MTVRIKGVKINSIDETETKRLKLIKIESKDDGISMLLELPDVLCEMFKVKDEVDVVIDSDEITKGEKARFYAEGSLFKMNEEKGLEVVGTIGGLKLILNIADPKPSQKKTFDEEKFFIMVT